MPRDDAEEIEREAYQTDLQADEWKGVEDNLAAYLYERSQWLRELADRVHNEEANE